MVMVAKETGRDTMSSKFYRHTIEILVQKRVPDGEGGSTTQWVTDKSFKGLMDTPNTSKQLQAMQMSKRLDRELYYAHGIEFPGTARIRCDGVQYEQMGLPENQGGQDRFMLIPLTEIR